MDLAQILIRNCMRAFYDTKHILVVDALIVHSALRDDDLAYLMSMNTKELHKLCGRLKEDRFLSVHTRPEIKEGQQRPMNRTYYYIDYRATIDAIKWRMYSIDKAVQGTTIPAEERKEYFCTRCKAEYTIMDVLSFTHGQEGFNCSNCGFTLKRDTGNNQGGHEQSTKLNAQFRFITDMLPKIDQVIIPENSFDKALANAVKVIRDASNLAVESAPLDATNHKPTAVKGMANTGPTKIAVTLTTGDGPSEADLAAERARKEKVAAQNAMPQHFTHSTITGEQVKFGGQTSVQASQTLGIEDKKDVDTSSANGDPSEIDNYFAQLKAEQAKEAEKEQEEEDDDDSEDEEEDFGFEDVMTGSAAATPATSTPTGGDDGRSTKKIKVEDHEESDEDNIEFEDV
ncbi:hypothetical protein B0O99DRAFT_624005 [Bisporella sp. PMI_857]|nr:hypothetical protein B0O99DRAFT_624005 [Bisporella sp. PMI_857]